MKTFECNHCGHECEISFIDKATPPEFCPVDGTGGCKWEHSKKTTCNCPQGSLCEFFEKEDESCLYGQI
jgi:hypothetical protein